MVALYTNRKRMHQEIKNDQPDLFHKEEVDSQYTTGSASARHFSRVWGYSLLQIRQRKKDIKEKTQ